MDADTTPTPTPRRRGSDDATGTSSAKQAQRDGHRGDCPKDKDRGGDSSGTSFDSSTEL